MKQVILAILMAVFAREFAAVPAFSVELIKPASLRLYELIEDLQFENLWGGW